MSKKRQFNTYEDREEDKLRKGGKKKVVSSQDFFDEELIDDLDYTAYKFLKEMGN